MASLLQDESFPCIDKSLRSLIGRPVPISHLFLAHSLHVLLRHGYDLPLADFRISQNSSNSFTLAIKAAQNRGHDDDSAIAGQQGQELINKVDGGYNIGFQCGTGHLLRRNGLPQIIAHGCIGHDEIELYFLGLQGLCRAFDGFWVIEIDLVAGECMVGDGGLPFLGQCLWAGSG